jgi:trehalose/maltose hydrolase-like predicted phosphorylase
VLGAHEAAWDGRWNAGEVRIEGDDESQRAIRFAVYHLTSAANPEDDLVSIGARALTGDAYLGHVFWDTEIYLLPFYTAVWPEAARSLLVYRFHTLPARAKAVQRYISASGVRSMRGNRLTPARRLHPSALLRPTARWWIY